MGESDRDCRSSHPGSAGRRLPEAHHTRNRSVRALASSLAAILVDAGVVTPEQVEAGLARQRSTGLRIGETLVEMGAATEEDICWALARQLALPFADPQPEAL